MDAPIEPAQRDRRRASRDRRRRVRDRRHFWPRFAPAHGAGRALRWLTGPWSSANGLSWLRLLILFLVVRWGVLAVYSIPTPSMEPTLHGVASLLERDRVAVNKLAFGVRVPFSERRLFATGSPKRWDIVAFDSPQATAEGRVLIKRVAGLPGEMVELRYGQLYVNQEPVEVPAEIAGSLHYTAGLEATPEVINQFLVHWAKRGWAPADILADESVEAETLQRDLRMLEPRLRDVDLKIVGDRRAANLVKDFDPAGVAAARTWWEAQLHKQGVPLYAMSKSLQYMLVPEGHYLLLGDNGAESIDGRMFGWVPHENLIGRAFAIVTPLGRARDLSGFMDSPRGRAIFFGVIALIAGWQLVPGFLVFSWRLRGAIGALGLGRGDSVLVSRIAYGPRLPFSQRRLVWWRRPVPGDVVAFLMSRSSSAFDLYFGDVLSVERDAGMRVIVRGPRDGGDAACALLPRDVVGRVVCVWRPWRRRGRVRPVAPLASGRADRLH